jgi:hypothetical protein
MLEMEKVVCGLMYHLVGKLEQNKLLPVKIITLAGYA